MLLLISRARDVSGVRWTPLPERQKKRPSRQARDRAREQGREVRPRPHTTKKNRIKDSVLNCRARDGDRTRDPLLGKEVLHH